MLGELDFEHLNFWKFEFVSDLGFLISGFGVCLPIIQ